MMYRLQKLQQLQKLQKLQKSLIKKLKDGNKCKIIIKKQAQV